MASKLFRMMTASGGVLIVIALFTMMFGSALAAVNYDPATGGFAGKGDVQTALGMNNPQIQAAAEDLVFTYDASQEVSWDCVWFTGPDHNRTRHSVPRGGSFDVDATVQHDARRQMQVTGFFLAPVDVELGEVNPSCENPNASVENLLEGDITGGLFVNGVALQ